MFVGFWLFKTFMLCLDEVVKVWYSCNYDRKPFACCQTLHLSMRDETPKKILWNESVVDEFIFIRYLVYCVNISI